MSPSRKIVIATRGSALALAQARIVQQRISLLHPRQPIEVKVFRTTGDELQSASPSNAPSQLPRGLFTKELEQALLESHADLAVHSLKDLPTVLPEGLALAAVLEREDARDVFLYRDRSHLEANRNPLADWSPGQKDFAAFQPNQTLGKLPKGATLATNSRRRAEQILAQHPALKILPIRGNVPTRLTRLLERPEMDGLLLALAGLHRLHWELGPRGALRLDPRLTERDRKIIAPPPSGILGAVLELDEMLPAVGQGAIGIEVRSNDPEIADLCARMNHTNTWRATLAERTFLAAMGGGCESSTAGHAQVVGHLLHFRGVAFPNGQLRSVSVRLPAIDPVRVGHRAASLLLNPETSTPHSPSPANPNASHN